LKLCLRKLERRESRFGTRRTIADVTYAFLFRPDPRRHTWPPYRLSRFWQRPAKTRATTRNAWESVWSRCRSQCQLFRPQRWVIITCEGEEGHTYRASDKVAPANRHFDIVSLASNYVSQLTRVSGTRTTTWHGHRNVSSIDLKLIIICTRRRSRVSSRIFMDVFFFISHAWPSIRCYTCTTFERSRRPDSLIKQFLDDNSRMFARCAYES